MNDTTAAADITGDREFIDRDAIEKESYGLLLESHEECLWIGSYRDSFQVHPSHQEHFQDVKLRKKRVNKIKCDWIRK